MRRAAREPWRRRPVRAFASVWAFEKPPRCAEGGNTKEDAMAHRTVLSLAAAVAAAAGLTAFVVRAAPPAAANGNYSDWGPPVNLGPVVNSTSADQHPAISRDGLSLYF